MANPEYSKSVTVVIPFQKNHGFLEEACLSVINQTYDNWKTILVADNANYESMEVAVKYITLDSRFTLIKSGKINSDVPGPWLARNQALKEIHSCYISFLDSDDIWHPKKLELQIKYCEENKLDLCTTTYIRFKCSNKRVVELRRPPEIIKINDLFPVNKIPLSSALIRHEILNDKKFRRVPHEDQDLWFQIFSTHRYLKAGNLNKVLMAYRIHKNNYTKGIKTKLSLKLKSLMHYGNCNLASIIYYCAIALMRYTISSCYWRFRVDKIYKFGFLKEN